MGQITATRNLVATKVVRLAGQQSLENYLSKISFKSPTGQWVNTFITQKFHDVSFSLLLIDVMISPILIESKLIETDLSHRIFQSTSQCLILSRSKTKGLLVNHCVANKNTLWLTQSRHTSLYHLSQLLQIWHTKPVNSSFIRLRIFLTNYVTQCGLVMPYGIRDLGQHQFR